MRHLIEHALHVLRARADPFQKVLAFVIQLGGADVRRLDQDPGSLARGVDLRTLGETMGGLAHNFNNSLAAILAYTELMLRESESEAARRRLVVIRDVALEGLERGASGAAGALQAADLTVQRAHPSRNGGELSRQIERMQVADHGDAEVPVDMLQRVHHHLRVAEDGGETGADVLDRVVPEDQVGGEEGASQPRGAESRSLWMSQRS